MKNKIWLLLVSTLLLPVLCSARDEWQQRDRVIRDLNLQPGAVVGDIGCGSGYFTFPLAEAVGEEGMIYATEISKKALKKVEDEIAKKHVSNIKPVLSDPTDTKVPDTCLDAAIIVNVLHHVPREQRADLIRDMVRSIKAGGFLYILDWRVDATTKHDRNNRIPLDEFKKYGADNGLTLDAEFHYLEQQVFLRFKK